MRLLFFLYWIYCLFIIIYGPLYMSFELLIYFHFCFSVFIGLLIFGPNDSNGFNSIEEYNMSHYSLET